ncbi:hypothetical protein MMC25_002387 [Agyrium rufum]|nr:hypothetical protein [Agyrium rufum]
MLSKVIREAEIDLVEISTRPEQLNLRDDPAFDLLADINDLNLDITFNSSTPGSSQQRSILSSRSMQSSQSSHGPEGFVLNTGNSEINQDGDLEGMDFLQASVEDDAFRGNLTLDEDGFDPNTSLTVDEDGNIVEINQLPPPDSAGNQRRRSRQLESASGLSANVGGEQLASLRAQVSTADDGMFFIEDDMPHVEDGGLHPTAEPFPEGQAIALAGGDPSPPGPEEDGSDYQDAPQGRRPRALKVIRMDVSPGLHHNEIRGWQTDYLDNMKIAANQKAHHKLHAQAKRNAAHWVFGRGLNAIGASAKFPDALTIFAGEALGAALHRLPEPLAGHTHQRDDEGDADGATNEDRNVRPRIDNGDQIGRGDEDGMLFDDNNIEMPRAVSAQTLQEESILPWNIPSSIRSASRQGSLIRPNASLGSRHMLSSSIDRGVGTFGGLGSFGTSSIAHGSSIAAGAQHHLDQRRASRLISASPLIGRGVQRPDELHLPGMEGDDADVDFGGLGIVEDQDFSFQLHGPAAFVATQTAGDSQWLKQTMEKEANNFFTFTRDAIEAKLREADTNDSDVDDGGVDLDGLGLDSHYEVRKMERSKHAMLFEELLPSQNHSRVVAAQAFSHVLALASRGDMHVAQETIDGSIGGFGKIWLKV